MRLFERFVPDLRRDTIYDIDIPALAKKGIRAVLLDIDNTLVTYDDPEPTSPVLRWFDALTAAGIRIAFISNNHEDRVARFNSRLGFYAAADSGKPAKREYLKAMAALGTDENSTAVIGDQIFTDVWAGKRLGLYSILVLPIKDKKTLFFRSKRLLEKPFLRVYDKRQRKKEKTK